MVLSMTLNCSFTNPEQTMSQTMIAKKNPAAITTRSLDSFMMFKEKEFVSGLQPFVTIQPLNKSKTRGWFIRGTDLSACGWAATEEDFDPGSAIFGYKQTFGMPPNTSVEEGINFVIPRIQMLLVSPLMVEETMDKRQVIGVYGGENECDVVATAAFDNDRVAADLASSKGEIYKRKYGIRTKYLIYILNKYNKRAHTAPVVLTVKGLNGTDMSEKKKLFDKEMGKCLSKALGMEVPLQFNEKFNSTTVFMPTLASDMRGSNNVEICGIESFEAPQYDTVEEAVESLSRLTIPDEDREDTWSKVSDPWFQDYINQHSKQDAKKLGGAYGIKDDVKILPHGAAVETKAQVVDTMTGEDSAL